jgi:HK97 family phage major capsid protein/HK97 family phage prohead protease
MSHIKHSMAVQPLTLKSITEMGHFTGYASVFNVPDQDQDIILPGAFSDSLQRYHSKGKRPKLLWQHDRKAPIGQWTEIIEDAHGLKVTGKLLLDVAQAREVYTLLQEGEIDGLSIGFISQKHQPNDAGGFTIEKVDLLEISLVTFPAHHQAQVHRVKHQALNNTCHPFNQQKEIIDMTQTQNTEIQERPAVAMTHKQDKERGFASFVRSGQGWHQKGLTTTADARGGHLIPEILHDKLLSDIEALSPLRKLARTMQISSSSVDVLLTHSIADAGWATELDDRAETEAGEISKLRINVHEIYAKPRATQKLLDDAKVDVEAWLIRGVADRMARMETAAFVNGDGNNKPTGFLRHQRCDIAEHNSQAIGTLNSGVDGDFPEQKPADLLIDLMQSLKTKYLRGACWVMSRSAMAAVRKLKDPATGHYLWQPGLGGSVSTLLGYPVEVCDEMPALQGGQAATAIAFGNFQEAYQIVDRSGMHILRDPYSAKPYVEFYITKRTGGAVVNPEALKLLSFQA